MFEPDTAESGSPLPSVGAALAGWRLDSLPSSAADEASKHVRPAPLSSERMRAVIFICRALPRGRQGTRAYAQAAPAPQVLRCDRCGAVTGLWNFRPGAPPPAAPIFSPAQHAVPGTPGAAAAAAAQQPQTPRTNITALFFALPPPPPAASAAARAPPAGAAAPGLPQPLHDLRLTIAGGAAPSASPAAGDHVFRPFGSGSAAPAFGSAAAAAAGASPSTTGKRPAGDDGGRGDAWGSAAKAPRLSAAASGGPEPSLPQGAGAEAQGSLFDPLLQHRRHCGWVCGAPAALEEADAATSCALALRRCGWMRTLAAAAPALPGARAGAARPLPRDEL